MNGEDNNNNGKSKLTIDKRILALMATVILFMGGILLAIIFRSDVPVEPIHPSGTAQITQSTDGFNAQLQNTPTPMATPGVVFFGYVRQPGGSGEANVDIYRKYSAYEGVLVATTDANGYYQSDFYSIPGDEMISIWAQKSGFKFTPEYYYWRHYYGYEGSQHDFTVASAGLVNSTGEDK